jgi:hypothetical protein
LFEARVGRVELLLPHSASSAAASTAIPSIAFGSSVSAAGPPLPQPATPTPQRPITCVVHFRIPEGCAVLPSVIRAKAVEVQPPDPMSLSAAALRRPPMPAGGMGTAFAAAAAALGGHGASPPLAGTAESPEPEHLIVFVRRCVLLHYQMSYQRSLAYYGLLVRLSSHMYPLLCLQAALALPLGLALLAPPSASPRRGAAANPWATQLPAPPPLLSGLHLALSVGLAALYVVRFGPSIISHREGLDGPDGDSAAAAAATTTTNRMASRRQRTWRNAPSSGGGSRAAAFASSGDDEKQRVAPLLLRLRLPARLWLPALDAAHAFRDGYRRLRTDARVLALRADRAALGATDGVLAPSPAAGGGNGASSPPAGDELHPLAPLAFGVLAARALLSDGTMALLLAQAACGLFALHALPPMAAALPLLSAIALAPPLRRLGAALVGASPSLARAVLAALLGAWLVGATGAHALPRACAAAGGPWGCADGADCAARVLEAAVRGKGLGEECALAAAAAGSAPARKRGGGNGGGRKLPIGGGGSGNGGGGGHGGSWSSAQEGWAALDAGAGWLPALQLGMALLVPLLLLAWSYTAIRASLATLPAAKGAEGGWGLASSSSSTAAHDGGGQRGGGGGGGGGSGGGSGGSVGSVAPARRDFISGRSLPDDEDASGSDGLGGLMGGGSGAPLSGLAERSAWHYCAYVCRVLATPDRLRSPAERHCARCLKLGGGTAWLPVPATLAGWGAPGSGAGRGDDAAAASLPLALLRVGRHG